MHMHHEGLHAEHICPDCKKPVQFDDHFHKRENHHHSVHHCPECHNHPHCPKCNKHHHSDHDCHDFDKHHPFRHHCPKCKKHHHSDHDCHELDKHHSSSHHCPKCRKHHDECGCIKTCEHPVIFDKRFIVDERFLHHGHFHCDDCCSCDKRCICDNRFLVRLAGLDGGMAFRLRQLIDCDVKLEVDCENGEEKVDGRICFVGSDFVEILTHKKERKKKAPKNRLRRKRVNEIFDCEKNVCKEIKRLIPFESIKSVTFDEHGCECCDEKEFFL